MSTTRTLKPCGTAGGYARHKSRKEPACEPCLIAWRDYHRDRRAAGYRPSGTVRELAPCGTQAAAQRHRKHGEPLCEACALADRIYKTEKAREYRAAKKRAALDLLLAETWAEVSAAPAMAAQLEGAEEPAAPTTEPGPVGDSEIRAGALSEGWAVPTGSLPDAIVIAYHAADGGTP